MHVADDVMPRSLFACKLKITGMCLELPGIIIHFFVGLNSFGSQTEVGFFLRMQARGRSLVGLMMLAGRHVNIDIRGTDESFGDNFLMYPTRYKRSSAVDHDNHDGKLMKIGFDISPIYGGDSAKLPRQQPFLKGRRTPPSALSQGEIAMNTREIRKDLGIAATVGFWKSCTCQGLRFATFTTWQHYLPFSSAWMPAKRGTSQLWSLSHQISSNMFVSPLTGQHELVFASTGNLIHARPRIAKIPSRYSLFIASPSKIIQSCGT